MQFGKPGLSACHWRPAFRELVYPLTRLLRRKPPRRSRFVRVWFRVRAFRPWSGAGPHGSGAMPEEGSSAPTSPRREASLLHLPGLRARFFCFQFVRGFSAWRHRYRRTACGAVGNLRPHLPHQRVAGRRGARPDSPPASGSATCFRVFLPGQVSTNALKSRAVAADGPGRVNGDSHVA